jgi:hypothetical protein
VWLGEGEDESDIRVREVFTSRSEMGVLGSGFRHRRRGNKVKTRELRGNSDENEAAGLLTMADEGSQRVERVRAEYGGLVGSP